MNAKVITNRAATSILSPLVHLTVNIPANFRINNVTRRPSQLATEIKAALQDIHQADPVADELLEFLHGAELIIHNAEFDVGFIEYELALMKHPKARIDDHATVLDTLSLARELHPGQRNSLDALCKRYEVDSSKRDVHGALIDAELLALVYLAMTGGQTTLLLDEDESLVSTETGEVVVAERRTDLKLVITQATEDELAAHEHLLDKVADGGSCVWRDE